MARYAYFEILKVFVDLSSKASVSLDATRRRPKSKKTLKSNPATLTLFTVPTNSKCTHPADAHLCLEQWPPSRAQHLCQRPLTTPKFQIFLPLSPATTPLLSHSPLTASAAAGPPPPRSPGQRPRTLRQPPFPHFQPPWPGSARGCQPRPRRLPPPPPPTPAPLPSPGPLSRCRTRAGMTRAARRECRPTRRAAAA